MAMRTFSILKKRQSEPKIKIRLATPNDVPQIKKMLSSANEKDSGKNPFTREYLRKNVDKEICLENTFYTVASVNGKIVGVARADFTSNIGILTNSYVHPDYRRKNFGQDISGELIKHRVRELIKRNVYRIDVQGNLKALHPDAPAKYEALGFKPINDQHVIEKKDFEKVLRLYN